MTSQMVERIMINVSKFVLFLPNTSCLYLRPANKIWGRVLFLHVFVCSQGDSLYAVTFCLVAWSNIPSEGSLSLVQCYFWGDLCPGGLCPGGSLSRGRVGVKGGLCPGGLCQINPHSINSGRYASYWNAFLFCHYVVSCLSF